MASFVFVLGYITTCYKWLNFFLFIKRKILSNVQCILMPYMVIMVNPFVSFLVICARN